MTVLQTVRLRDSRRCEQQVIGWSSRPARRCEARSRWLVTDPGRPDEPPTVLCGHHRRAREEAASARAEVAVQKALSAWERTRAELRALEAAAHPDITDRFGRVWTWRSGDLYTHDDTLAMTSGMIRNPAIGLPAPGLAESNPNYRNLCDICRGSA